MVTVGNRYREVKVDRFTYSKLDRYVWEKGKHWSVGYAQLHVRWELCMPIEQQLIGASRERECGRGLKSWYCVERAEIALC